MADSCKAELRKKSLNEKNILKPSFCCIAVTDYCMLRCKMCNKWRESIPKKKEIPSLDEWKSFITGFRELVDEGFEMNFAGGEALSMPGVLGLVRFAKAKGFKTTMTSNGYLINKDMAKRIADAGLDAVSLSLDSLNPEVHDNMRGVNGVAQRIFKAIEYLRKYSKNMHIGICTIIMEQTLDGLIELAEWVNTNRDKTNSILFMAAMQPNNTPFDPSWYKKNYDFFWPKDIKKVHAVLDELIRRRKLGHWIGDSVAQLEAFKAYFENPGRFVKKSPCNLDRAMHVSSFGKIFFCYRHGILGNIKNGDDVRQIWHSDAAGKVRADIKKCQHNCHFLLNCFFEGDYPFMLEGD